MCSFYLRFLFVLLLWAFCQLFVFYKGAFLTLEILSNTTWASFVLHFWEFLRLGMPLQRQSSVAALPCREPRDGVAFPDRVAFLDGVAFPWPYLSWLWMAGMWISLATVMLCPALEETLPWNLSCAVSWLHESLGKKIKWTLFKSNSGQEGLVILTQFRYHRGVCLYLR